MLQYVSLHWTEVVTNRDSVVNLLLTHLQGINNDDKSHLPKVLKQWHRKCFSNYTQKILNEDIGQMAAHYAASLFDKYIEYCT